MNTCVQCIYRRCAACSELRSVRVNVHCGVHAIVHDVLKIVEVVREDARSFHVAIVYRKMFVNIRCRMYSIYTPVGDSRRPSAVTDLFTVKILNSLHVETLSENRYRTTKERVAPCYQWSYHL